MILRGFVTLPNESHRDAVMRIAGGAIDEYDARIRLGFSPELAALETLDELGLTKSIDTEDLTGDKA
jgi:hypothetical protein